MTDLTIALQPPEESSPKTGEFCFQFNDGEVTKIADVYSNDPITITLQQEEEQDDSSIEFTNGENRFRIFIRKAT